MVLFNHRELSSKNFMHKILDTNPKGNFIIELENMLSDYENSLDSLSISNIKNIASKYNVDLTNDYLEERKELLFRMLTRALGGNNLNDFEYRKLKHLCNILGLDILVLDKEISKRGTDIYRKKLEEIFADKYVSAEEKAELEQLRIQLKIKQAQKKCTEKPSNLRWTHTQNQFLNPKFFLPKMNRECTMPQKTLACP